MRGADHRPRGPDDRARGDDGRGTVGQLLVSPNSRTVIPGEVRFSVEFRHPDPAEIHPLDAQFPREAQFIARDCGVVLELKTLFRIPAQPFDPAHVELVRGQAACAGWPDAISCQAWSRCVWPRRWSDQMTHQKMVWPHNEGKH